MNFLSHQSAALKRTVKVTSISTKFFDQGICPAGWIDGEPSSADRTAHELWEYLKRTYYKFLVNREENLELGPDRNFFGFKNNATKASNQKPLPRMALSTKP